MEELSRRRNVWRPENGNRGSGLTPLTAKLMICIAIFAIATVVRFVYGTESVRTAVVENIERNAGYTAVFSEMGRALTDGEGIGSMFKDGILSVFGAQTADDGQKDENHTVSESAGESADNAMQENLPQQPGEQQDDISPIQEPVTSPAGVEPVSLPGTAELTFEMLVNAGSVDEDVDDTPPTLFQISPPDNVSLEKPMTGFSYTIPLKGRITSAFGYRDHPIDDDTKFHYGVDIAASTGAAIKSFADGKVTRRAYNSINGYYIFIEHKNGFVSVYCHCSKLKVSLGQKVTKGQVIALAGSSGSATGPHLHFELRHEGKILDPTFYFDPEVI